MTLFFTVKDHAAAQNLAEMILWPPPQGTDSHVIPLDIELRFDEQIVRFPKFDLTVKLARAEIEILLTNFIVVRNSRFGDVINEPYVVADITQSVRNLIELETESDFQFDVTISKNYFGKLFGALRRRRRNLNEKNNDRIAKAAIRHYRVIARNSNRWTVMEPVAPHILSGRYLGERRQTKDEEISSPLCLLTAHNFPASVRIFLRARLDSIVITQSSGLSKFSRNKEAIIAQIARTCIVNNVMEGIQPIKELDELVLCISDLRCENV